ncbi:MAG: hypothetical protein U9R53_00595 [Chloroflexota bacterium]|nr:hypothetical protein [Chloroflexota bacterium]
MGKIGHGYGSEWHLLRYLGYHRSYFSEQILQLIGGQRLEWLDFNFSKINDPLKRDRELVGLEFIDNPDVQRQWHAFWPHSGNAQNWDGVGKININGRDEWLLVEAKAHIHEEKGGGCQASIPRSKENIEQALVKTMGAFCSVSQPLEHWLGSYYQYANRLAALHFLMRECQPTIPTRLLFIFFLGDKHDDQTCPKNRDEWESIINEVESCLRIERDFPLYERVHHLFIHVNPDAKIH